MNYKITLVLVPVIVILFFLIAEHRETLNNSKVVINIGKEIGKIGIRYGSNEDSWMEFTQNTLFHNLNKNIGSEYIRIWISCVSYMNPSMPFDGKTYNFTLLDDYVNAVLDSNAIPFVVFANGIESCGQEANGNPPPSNDYDYANYVEKVVKHFKNNCVGNLYSKPCNVDDWYFEVWNEPYQDAWWEGNPPRFSLMFNITYLKIKAITKAKVGGPPGAYAIGSLVGMKRMASFLANSNPDFISIHHYGNMLLLNSFADYGETKKMNDIPLLFYDSILALRQLAIQTNKSNIEIINSEYNSDSRAQYMERLDEPFTASWYASALINQIKSQEVSIELFYAGTSTLRDGGFGMWDIDGRVFPVYTMKKSFVKYNKKGSSILETVSSSDIDVLATENEGEKFVTLVNKKDKVNTIELNIPNGSLKFLLDLRNEKKFLVSGANTAEISLQPYEVKFLQMI